MPSEGRIKDITQETLEEVAALAGTLPKEAIFDPKSRRDVALHRFHLGMAEGSPADRLINFTVALEAAVLPPSFEGELRFKFALYGARFLGDTAEERSNLFKKFTDVYDTRSKVVHGSKPPPTPKLIDAASTAGDLTARLLLKLAREGWLTSDDFREEAISAMSQVEEPPAPSPNATGLTQSSRPE